MLLLQSNQAPANTNLPSFAPTALQKAVYAISGLSLWAEGDASLQTGADSASGTFSGYIAGQAMTVVGNQAGSAIATGELVTGIGVTPGTYIVSGSGTSWTVSKSQNVGSAGAPITITNSALGSFTQWIDKMTGRLIGPLSTSGTKPLVIQPAGALSGAYPGRRALRSNFLSTTADNRLGLVDGGAQVLAATFTLATVFRIPVPPANGGTEVTFAGGSNIVSTKLDAGFLTYGAAAAFGPRYSLGVASLENGATPAIQDAGWHYRIATMNGSTGAWVDRIDGAQAGAGTTTDRLSTATSNGYDLTVCGSGLTSAVQRYTGEVGAVFAIPGRSLTDAGNAADLATLEQYLALIKTQMNGS